ncbi:MAG TPA: methyltransferase domain-containing protein, partial [Ignavibacteriaceae bacterium]|nr:methyltransferase domain-containing protein [Ignavibacteriaceae bacterium]
DVHEGMRVLDLCAAPGGKTAYIAAIMHSKGEIVAIDKFESRLKLLQKNNDRLGLNCVKTIESDALEYSGEIFDRVLADVPCSGTGTLSKKPDIKWKKDLFDIRQMNIIQLKLLRKAAELVQPGGAVVYSTCSIEPEENFEIVKKFLGENQNFRLEDAREKFPLEILDQNGCIQIFPHKHKLDGAFAAKLVRIQ